MIEPIVSRADRPAARTPTRTPYHLPTSPLLALTLALAVIAAACGAGDNPAGSGPLTTTVDTVDGVIRVVNQGSPPTWELRELLTLGSAGGAGSEPEDDEFGRITGLLADGDGQIYVADGQSYDIRVFDPEGRLRRRLGRQGAGPGEFGMLQSIGWIGDTLAALDASNGRLGLLRTDGEWVGHRPYMALSGTIRLHQTGPDEVYMPMIHYGDDGGDLVYIRQTPVGSADTLAVPAQPTNAPTASSSVICRFEGGVTFYRVDFAPKLIFAPAPGTLGVRAWTADYRIAFTNVAGDTVRLVERDLPPLPVTNEAWRAEEQKFQEWQERFAGASCEPARPSRPAARSTIREIFFDDVGNTWIERETESGWAYDIFDPAGHLLAELPAPDRKTGIPPYVRGDRLHLVVTDEMDVEYVRVFAIERVERP